MLVRVGGLVRRVVVYVGGGGRRWAGCGPRFCSWEGGSKGEGGRGGSRERELLPSSAPLASKGDKETDQVSGLSLNGCDAN